MSIAILASGAALVFGCARILGFGDVPSPADGGPDANEEPAADASADATPDAGACALFHVPPPPASDDPSDAGDQSFVVAVHTIDFGVEADGGPPPLLGLDLDGVDTCCQGGPESCKPAVAGSTHCDDPGGRDNQEGRLLGTVETVAPGSFDQNVIDQRFASGVESLLLQVSHYNGQPNDTQVTVAMFASHGLVPGPDGGAATAQWNGTDTWTVDPRFVVGGADAGALVPTHFDTQAYVADGVLVGKMELPLPFPANGVDIDLTSAIAMARIEPALGSFRLAEGMLAGRWTAPSVLTWVQTIRTKFGYVCKGTSLYSNVKQTICASLDVVGDPTQDRTGATCDALSLAVGFTADPAQLGPSATGANPLTCPDAGPGDCTMP